MRVVAALDIQQGCGNNDYAYGDARTVRATTDVVKEQRQRRRSDNGYGYGEGGITTATTTPPHVQLRIVAFSDVVPG